MDLEGLFKLEIIFDHEADVTFNAATNISEESAEAVAIREASSLSLPCFDELVHSLHDMESVNLFTYCYLSMLKFLNEEPPHQKVLRKASLGSCGFL